MPIILFRADLFVNTTDFDRSKFFTFLIASSLFKILTGTCVIKEALTNVSIFSCFARYKALNFSAIVWRKEIYLLFKGSMDRWIFKNQCMFNFAFHLAHVVNYIIKNQCTRETIKASNFDIDSNNVRNIFTIA